MDKRITIKEVFDKGLTDQSATVKGWVRSVRKSKKWSFMVVNDGTTQQNLQIVLDATMDGHELASNLLTGSAVGVTGKLVESQGRNQSIEMQATAVEVIGNADETYPLQKKATSLEFLRENAHLRARTNTFGAVFRIRHTLALATHEFFDSRGYFYANTPIVTAIDAEGAGEMFNVTTFDLAKVPLEAGKVLYEQDYFARQAYLAVTGQLEAECLACGLGGVYTFGPTFRSENSNTPRHLSEFWMIEPEVAFAELDDIADLAVDYIKFMIRSVLEKNPLEMDFLIKRPGAELTQEHVETLKNVLNSDFARLSYTEAIEILQASGKKFEFTPEWGAALQTEHERYLTDVHFKGPAIVTDYPKECKAFYMKQNPDGKTVRAMDVLVPGVGEIIGGSQREDSYDRLLAWMKELKLDLNAYWWYLDLRKHGTVPHAGFGLGFERAVMYITGMKNIRDVIPFPRTPRSVDF